MVTHPFLPLPINKEELPTHRGVAVGGTGRLVGAERDYGRASGKITSQERFCVVHQRRRDTGICDAEDRQMSRSEEVGQGVDRRIFGVIECSIDIVPDPRLWTEITLLFLVV